MKKILSILFISLLINTSYSMTIKEKIKNRIEERQLNNSQNVFIEQNIVIDNIERKFLIYIPKKLNKEQNALLAFHGGGGNMYYQAKYYGIVEKSNQEGFIAVFLNGYSKLDGNFATWNAGNCCANARDKNIDDIKFIEEVIKYLKNEYKIDNLYATGMSNGAMMSYRMACEIKDIKAIAAVAGTDVTKYCKPNHPVSILHIHAKDDTHVLFNGGAGKEAFKDKSKVTDFPAVQTTINKWIDLNKINPSYKKVLEKDGAYCNLYQNKETKIQLCVTETGGHSWPGAKEVRGKTPSNKLNANDVMWNFFNSL